LLQPRRVGVVCAISEPFAVNGFFWSIEQREVDRVAVPSDKTTGLTFYGEEVGAEHRAVVIPNQKRAVRSIPHELGIEPALIDHDPGDCQRDGCVSTRSNSGISDTAVSTSSELTTGANT
jgi:hypothetical protein